jgi:hypothetical protein
LEIIFAKVCGFVRKSIAGRLRIVLGWCRDGFCVNDFLRATGGGAPHQKTKAEAKHYKPKCKSRK